MATYQLTVLLGAATGQRFDVPETGGTLGRSQMANFRVMDNGLSRLHCRFYSENGFGMVQDLASSNGTMVNGADIGTTPTRITNGDCVTVGETVLRISGLAESPVSPKSEPVTDVLKTEKVTFPEVSVVPTASDALPATPLFSVNPDAVVAETPAKPEPAGSASAPDLGTMLAQAAGAPAGEGVDLGLNASAAEEKKRSPLLGLIFALVAILVLLCGALAIFSIEHEGTTGKPLPLPSSANLPFEFAYEQLRITEESLYRYNLTYESSGYLTLVVEDLGEADRSFTKRLQLSEQVQKVLRKEVLDSNYTQIRKFAPERSADGISLQRKKLTVVVGSYIWERVAENVEDRAFDSLCERLELFATNELNSWATRYSVAELREMAREQLAVGKRYWEQRDMGDDKLFQALLAYEKGVAALDTLNPKPEFSHELTHALREAVDLLAIRYEEASFNVDQAMSTKRYDRAADELRRILRMIPDREDERNLKATEQLLLIENRYLRNGGR